MGSRGFGDAPRAAILVVIGKDREGRDDVFLEVLVLVVAPHDDDIGVELIDDAARLGEMRAVDFAAARRRRGAQSFPSSSRSGAGQEAGFFISVGIAGSSSAARSMKVQSSFGRSISGRCVHPTPRISPIRHLPFRN